MKKVILSLLSWLISCSTALALGSGGNGNGGGQETNGGDGVVAQYIFLFDEMMNLLPNKIVFLNGKMVEKRKLIESKEITNYSSVESLQLDGDEKAALNQPRHSPPRIIIGRKFWKSLDLEGRRLLILHEQLHIAGFDDSDYFYSTNIYERLISSRFYPAEMLDESVSTCQPDFLDRISKRDLDAFPKEAQEKALFRAIFNGCDKFVKLWTQWGKNVNICRMVSPLSALIVAPIGSFKKRITMAQMLLNAGASPNFGCTLSDQNACRTARNNYLFPQNEILENLMGCRR